VEHSNLIPPKDMEVLEFYLKRNSIPNLLEGIQNIASAGGTLRATAATSLAYVASGKPSHMLAAIVASGSLPALRRAMMVPKGSPTWRRAALVVANNIAKLSNEVAGATNQSQAGEDELRDLREPPLG
jgi:hypothetical protein